MRPIMILAAAALGGLLAASSTSKTHALGYTFTDLNVPGSQPGSTGAFDGLAINNPGQIAGSYIDRSVNFDGFLYMGGKYVTADAPGAIDTSIYGINDRGQLVETASYSNGSNYDLIATIAILLLLLIAAGSRFAGWKARDVGRYVIWARASGVVSYRWRGLCRDRWFPFIGWPSAGDDDAVTLAQPRIGGRTGRQQRGGLAQGRESRLIPL